MNDRRGCTPDLPPRKLVHVKCDFSIYDAPARGKGSRAEESIQRRNIALKTCALAIRIQLQPRSG